MTMVMTTVTMVMMTAMTTPQRLTSLAPLVKALLKSRLLLMTTNKFDLDCLIPQLSDQGA
jgi:hypothetical protein